MATVAERKSILDLAGKHVRAAASGIPYCTIADVEKAREVQVSLRAAWEALGGLIDAAEPPAELTAPDELTDPPPPTE